jgi:transposase InsO family protein
MFVDGYSRFVTGIGVHDNNRASTVCHLFEEAVAAHGQPRRVRGDHGTENLLVAALMESLFALESAPYLWGRQEPCRLGHWTR